MRSADSSGTWLCPTPFHRTRLLEMEARLAPAHTAMYVAVAVAFVVCGPRLGWWALAPVAIVAGSYRLLLPRIATAGRPEYVVATMVVIAQVQIGMGIAVTGGPVSPVLVLLLLPIVTLPARFGTRGVVAGVVLTLLVLAAATAGVEPQAFLAHPEPPVIAAAATFGLAAFSDALMRAGIQQRSDSAQDALTGLLNRKALTTQFAEVSRQAAVTGRPVCLLLLDLDRFKAVNDQHGHARGDAVLRDAAEALRGNLRSFELIYRVGGEEFLVLMPGVDRTGGRAVAERLREAMHAARPGDLVVTASIGVAVAHGQAATYETLFDAADQALYAAKHNGRNRVVVAPELRPVPGTSPISGTLPLPGGAAPA